MADEVLRIRIQKALQKCLEGITPDNGYTHDLSNPGGSYLTRKVFRGRVIFGDKDPLPLVSILEVPIPLDQVAPPEDSVYSSGGWELVIQGFVKDDKENPTDPAHVLMAEVKQQLALEKAKHRDYRMFSDEMGKHFTESGMLIGAGVVRPPDEISSKAYFWLNVTLYISENLANPYNDD